MKRIITFLIILLSGASNLLHAQDSGSKTLERNIKVSGNYFYGDGVSSSASEAEELAMSELKIMISEYVREENPDVPSIDFSGFEDNIGTVSIALDVDYVRVIAFVLKSEISLQQKDLKTMMVIRIAPDGPVVVSTDAAAEEVVTPTPVVTPVVTSVAVDTTAELEARAREEEAKAKAEAAASEEATRLAAEAAATAAAAEAAAAEAAAAKAEAAAEAAAQTTVVTPVTTSSGEPIIDEILALTNSKDVGVLLNTYKDQGKLVYGRLATISDPSQCYFVILKSGKLVDVLAPGSSVVRTGLISNSSVDYLNVKDTLYWVYIF